LKKINLQSIDFLVENRFIIFIQIKHKFDETQRGALLNTPKHKIKIQVNKFQNLSEIRKF
jgi:hypothetical protein